MRIREDSRIQRVLAVLEHLSPETRKEVLRSIEMVVGACAVVEQQRSGNGAG